MTDLKYPLVSIICLSYNHQDFVEEAIQSVLDQKYSNIELIVIDNNSSDGSVQVIKNICSKFPHIHFIENKENIGNCKAFNQGFKLCHGQYIIDLAADDILLSDRTQTGVSDLQKEGNLFGVHYTDAMIIDEAGQELGTHTQLTRTVDNVPNQPEGNIFTEILGRYFICPPTIMAKREVFEELGGYDETLTFEDFDFLVRSSRIYKFCYSPKVLVKRRVVIGSQSDNQYKRGSQDLWSVYKVCKKALDLVETKPERVALNRRLQYECRQAIILGESELVREYIALMEANNASGLQIGLYKIATIATGFAKFF